MRRVGIVHRRLLRGEVSGDRVGGFRNPAQMQLTLLSDLLPHEARTRWDAAFDVTIDLLDRRGAAERLHRLNHGTQPCAARRIAERLLDVLRKREYLVGLSIEGEADEYAFAVLAEEHEREGNAESRKDVARELLGANRPAVSKTRNTACRLKKESWKQTADATVRVVGKQVEGPVQHLMDKIHVIRGI